MKEAVTVFCSPGILHPKLKGKASFVHDEKEDEVVISLTKAFMKTVALRQILHAGKCLRSINHSASKG